MGDSEGEYEGPRDGFTPFCDAEEGDMKRFLAKTFSPALMASAPGSLVAATTWLQHDSQKRKYSTLATLSYQGKKWVGGASGKWKAQEYKLLSICYVRGGLRHSGPGGSSLAKFRAWWGGGGTGVTGGIRKCFIGKPAFHSYATCVRAISAAGHRKKKAFSGEIIDIVTKVHLDHCEMVAALDSQVARLVVGAYGDSDASQQLGGW
jgi:hypothetical protein